MINEKMISSETLNMIKMSKPASPHQIRSVSPAISEISVGSPSPPPAQNNLLPLGPTRGSVQTIRKSSSERVKSFSIDDILGNKDESDKKTYKKTEEKTVLLPLPWTPGHSILSTHINLPGQLQPSPAPFLIESAPGALAKIPLTWDPSRPVALPLNPLLHSATFLHYDQRVAWDYQRQLHHFQVQAQMLREMSLDPGIIPSEDGGSERSHSPSSNSNCCTPTDSNTEKSNNLCQPDDKSNDSDIEHDSKSSKDNSEKSTNDTPLDALFQLSTKNFDEEQDPATLSLFATRPNPKKKRKSRTAFTNHQIFKLEQRFLYQKYLSPADRDEIAASLGLSNAQVITWFQNRRAKLKRDMEELKKDVESVKQLSAHKSFLENVNDLTILKTRPTSRQLQPIYQQEHEYPQSTIKVYQGSCVPEIPESECYDPNSHARRESSPFRNPISPKPGGISEAVIQTRNSVNIILSEHNSKSSPKSLSSPEPDATAPSLDEGLFQVTNQPRYQLCSNSNSNRG